MINPHKIKKILFILSIFTILILIYLCKTIPIKEISIERLNNLTIKDNDKTFKVIGEIKEIIYEQDKVSFYLKNSSIRFIAFTEKIILLKENQLVLIEGKINYYNNYPSFLVNKINTKQFLTS